MSIETVKVYKCDEPGCACKGGPASEYIGFKWEDGALKPVAPQSDKATHHKCMTCLSVSHSAFVNIINQTKKPFDPEETRRRMGGSVTST